MKKIFYSQSIGGFLHADLIMSMPDDAKEITAELHSLLLDGQSQGKRISADESGQPILVDAPPATVGEVWRLIQAERDRRKNGGFLLSGKWYHSDPESLTRYLGLVQLGANVPTRQWKTMDGTLIQMSQQLAADIFNAAVAHDSACFDAAEAHKAAMQSLGDPSTYDFSGGWPDVYN
ncbi:MAG: DUF4376 domain-containing protein [Methylomicrobium sp.]